MEPKYTSTCTLSNENSSDDSSVNKQGLYFIFPPFLLPWPSSSPRVQSSPASKLLWGLRERGNLLWERCRIKGACEGWSKVKWTNLYLVHSRSWLFRFAKVSAHLFRRRAGLSPLSGSMDRPAETRARRGRQSCTCAWLAVPSLRFLTGTVLLFHHVEHGTGRTPPALSLLQLLSN